MNEQRTSMEQAQEPLLSRNAKLKKDKSFVRKDTYMGDIIEANDGGGRTSE